MTYYKESQSIDYYIEYNQYKCCDTCPPSYPYLDLSKKQCFDECPNYIYNNMCYDKCPDNTKIMKGNICFDDDQCMSSYSTLNVLKESLSSIYYDSLIKQLNKCIEFNKIGDKFSSIKPIT